ncbi:unnamed protein product [Gongylonema pulchrum]|uniref:Uncharacterized protein n=1 Tax=Gongylonema pulchrum TaxID=637853 RepID=A0A183DMT1_9BILA|nr:unnamed protein product [Gongylonema pulchrum]
MNLVKFAKMNSGNRSGLCDRNVLLGCIGVQRATDFFAALFKKEGRAGRQRTLKCNVPPAAFDVPPTAGSIASAS